MEWEFTGDKPIYQQLVEQMQLAVVTGVYPAGTKLPAVRELAAEAGVNPNTMQRALAELEQEGLVYTQRTSGRYVTDDAAKIAARRGAIATGIVAAFVKRMRELGYAPDEIQTMVNEAKEEL